MGALHEGHLSLVRRAREETDVVAFSVFVNPLQFGDPSDLANYPRLIERDLRLAENHGVDVAFTPSEAEMYPNGEPEVVVHVGPIGDRLEGASRPGHFDGVATVVTKLFNLAGPCIAYFGQKDAQQLAVIRRMVADLDVPVTVVGCETVREPDGLAMSQPEPPPHRRAAGRGAVPVSGACRTPSAWCGKKNGTRTRVEGGDGETDRRRAAGEARLRRDRR